MKKLAILSVLSAISVSAFAQETEQKLSPKESKPFIFFQKHEEKSYNYTMYGIGMSFEKPINDWLSAGLQVGTSYDKTNLFVDSSIYLNSSFEINDLLNFGFRTEAQKKINLIFKRGTQKYNVIVREGTVKFGPQIGLAITDIFDINIEGLLVKDVYRTASAHNDEFFWGNRWPKPWGFDTSIQLVTSSIDQTKQLGLKVGYGRTFSNQYENYKVEISHSWKI